jgi:hypothetical protein
MENTLAREISLLEIIHALNNNAIRRVSEFMFAPGHHELANQYQRALEKRNVDLGFNLFAIISDLYYRENFHSDILRALLDPKSSHHEEEKYFHLFLEFLKQHGANIHLNDYVHSLVVREKGRLDILIKDEVSKRAIIIENKINNAGDMHRQLPRYLEYVKELNYKCDAVIYLRLYGYAGPDTTGWSDEDREQVRPLLKIVCAYDETENDLLNGWILKCQESSNNPDAAAIFRQYGSLIKRLGGNIMNKPIMKDFYDIMLEGENLRTAQSLKAMLEELVLFRVERIIDLFRNDLGPFEKLSNYGNDTALFTNCFWKDAHFGIDVEVYPESYSFCFWDRSDSADSKGLVKIALERMKCIRDYIYKDGWYVKEFTFPKQEEELILHIRSFKARLTTVVTQRKGT